MLVKLASHFQFELGRPGAGQRSVIESFDHASIYGRIVVAEQNGTKGGVIVEVTIAVAVGEVCSVGLTKNKVGRKFPGRAGHTARDQFRGLFE